jgi:hypothetical protein
MTINTATILAVGRSEELLALQASLMVRGPEQLPTFLEACERDLLARFTTPEGRDADELYSHEARELLDILEAWQDDPHGAWEDIQLLTAPDLALV